MTGWRVQMISLATVSLHPRNAKHSSLGTLELSRLTADLIHQHFYITKSNGEPDFMLPSKCRRACLFPSVCRALTHAGPVLTKDSQDRRPGYMLCALECPQSIIIFFCLESSILQIWWAYGEAVSSVPLMLQCCHSGGASSTLCVAFFCPWD